MAVTIVVVTTDGVTIVDVMNVDEMNVDAMTVEAITVDAMTMMAWRGRDRDELPSGDSWRADRDRCVGTMVAVKENALEEIVMIVIAPGGASAQVTVIVTVIPGELEEMIQAVIS